MIIWKGWGFLSILIALAGAVIGTIMTGLFDHGGRSQALGIALGLVMAAVANWFVGRALNRSRREGNAGAFNRHSLFFMPMEWFSAAMLVGAIFVFVVAAR